MPRLLHSNPTYRKHASGQAIVTIDGKDFYLGPWKTNASKTEYDRLIGEWLANGRRLKPGMGPITIAELIDRFTDHAAIHYRHADGTPTGEADLYKLPLLILYRLYGDTPAADFGPLGLEAVRNEMIAKGWVRKSINSHVGRIQRVFKWGVSKQLVPVTVYQALTTLAGLQAGRSKAQESEPVKPVPLPVLDATLPHLSRVVDAMVRLQLVTGARPGELVLIRTGDIDRSEAVWVYRPMHHKTAHKGHSREIYLGRNAQEIITPFLKMDPTAFVFSPRDAELERREVMTEARVVPAGCGHCVGTNRKRRPKKQPGERYTTGSYRRAVADACDKTFPMPDEIARAKVPGNGRKHRFETRKEWKARVGVDGWKKVKQWRQDHTWHPHQLRHNAGTNIRRHYGMEASQVFLGHKSMNATAIYAERDAAAARRVAEAVG